MTGNVDELAEFNGGFVSFSGSDDIVVGVSRTARLTRVSPELDVYIHFRHFTYTANNHDQDSLVGLNGR
jgi:hypothetical protein